MGTLLTSTKEAREYSLAGSESSGEEIVNQSEVDFLDSLSEILPALARLFRMADEEVVENPVDPPSNNNNNNNVVETNNCNNKDTLDGGFDRTVNTGKQQYLSVKIEFKEKDWLSTDSNYDMWNIRMTGFLKEANLWMFVDGSHPRSPKKRILFAPETSTPTDEQREWDRLDQRA